MKAKRMQIEEASELLDALITKYNMATLKITKENVAEAARILELGVLAVKSAGIKVTIHKDEKEFIDMLDVNTNLLEDSY